MDEKKKPIKWDGKDYWEVTEQTSWQKKIVNEPNPGDHWCICKNAFIRFVKGVGCENITLKCDATDVQYVVDAYTDTGHIVENDEALLCIINQCPTYVSAKTIGGEDLEHSESQND